MQTPIRSHGKLAWPRANFISEAKTRGKSSPTEIGAKKYFDFLPQQPSKIRPQLRKPEPLPRASFQPSRSFSNRRHEPKIFTHWNLLSESFESTTTRAIPYNSSLIRSFCKGTGILKKEGAGARLSQH